jgi:hypothetical protein
MRDAFHREYRDERAGSSSGGTPDEALRHRCLTW